MIFLFLKYLSLTYFVGACMISLYSLSNMLFGKKKRKITLAQRVCYIVSWPLMIITEDGRNKLFNVKVS